MFAVFCVLFLTTPELISAPASHSVLDEVAFKTLGFEFEMLLKNHLRDWRFLTETPTEMDMGEFFSKRNFISRSNTTSPEDLKNDTRNPDQIKKHISINSPGNNLKDSEVSPPKESDLIDFSEQDHMAANIPPDLNTESGASGPTRKLDSNAIEVSERSGRAARDAGIPVIYMPGKKKKRKCSQVSGLLAGFNTFNYLTFVTGVITLVVNANNNINNNNNNNNLNNNNDISNNNVNANTNTQNANQVVIFPPGRKRRSIADWLLQVLNLPSVKGAKTPAATPPTVSKGSWCGAAEAATVALQLFDSWVQASSGVSGECGWAEYCFLLHNLGRREGVSAALFNPARTFSTLVAPAWVASSASCFLQRAKCRIV